MDGDIKHSEDTPPKNAEEKLDDVLTRYSSHISGTGNIAELKTYRPPANTYYRSGDIRSSSFDASNLQKIVDEIKVIEDGLKNIIASRTTQVIEEKIPVEKQRPVKYNIVGKLLVSVGLKAQETETYTDYDIRHKEIPRNPDDVAVTEFRVMIEKYIHSLKGLNEGLRDTVVEVDRIVKNLTEVSDAFTDQIHSDRRAYHAQISKTKELEVQLKEVIPIHESMSPLHERYADMEKLRDHLEMALRDSQGMELKYNTNIDMGVKYQSALKSYRKLINDFKERGDIHVNMVDKFAQGAEHMKVAVDNVSQICSGVARVTQSMIMIVDSIDDGNRVLGRYAALVGDQMSASPQWQMEYSALKEAEAIYQKNDEHRLLRIEENRHEIEKVVKATQQISQQSQ
ncbi:MAG: hypothetical protein BWK80_32730 [Desulfobacteraceae bacterium IS3]|nr:MAG: hypothetical protein BWK80_32730 [Desulfobacteraceae bacterium IS3]HAO20342.1 hypothetical protein [Desulfobacteraceae bacterium]